MRRIHAWAIIPLLLTLVLAGCGRTAVIDRLAARLDKMTGYQSSFQMTHILPDGNQTTYLVDQWVAGDRYRVELSNDSGQLQQTLICDGETLTVRHAPQGLSYAIVDGQGTILGQDLLTGRLMTSLTARGLDLRPQLVSLQGASAWLLELKPGLLQSDSEIGQKLWLDAREFTPRQLELYASGTVVTRLVFTQFVWNPIIAPERFIASTPATGKALQVVRIGQAELGELHGQLPFKLYQPQQLPKGAYLNLVTVVEEEGDPVVVQNYVWNDCALCLVERPVHDLGDFNFGQKVELAEGRRARLLTTGQVCTLWWRIGDVELMLSGCLNAADLISFAKTIY